MTEISKKPKKLYVPRVNARCSGKMYADGDRLHALLCQHRDEWQAELATKRLANPGIKDRNLKVRVPVSNELGLIIMTMVDELMYKGNYYLYTSEWREMIRHEALKSMLLYCHCYDPDKATIRRQELNSNRVKPLAPVPTGKQAWNYLSWIANKQMGVKILKLKAAEELAKSVGLGTFDIFSIGMPDDDNSPSISEDLIAEQALRYQPNPDDDDAYVDPLEAVTQQGTDNAKAEYLEALETARRAIVARTDDPKILSKLEKRVKELTDFAEGKQPKVKRAYRSKKSLNTTSVNSVEGD
jgi:hypothetical protein